MITSDYSDLHITIALSRVILSVLLLVWQDQKFLAFLIRSNQILLNNWSGVNTNVFQMEYCIVNQEDTFKNVAIRKGKFSSRWNFVGFNNVLL